MTGNSAQIAEQNINFHKELLNTTIMWSVGGMVVLSLHVRMWDEVMRGGMEASHGGDPVASSLEPSRTAVLER